MAKGLTWLAAAALVGAGLVADSLPGPNVALIAYIGSSSADKDQAYGQFVKALRQRKDPVLREARLEYVGGRDPDDASISLAVDSALAKAPQLLVAPTGRTARIARLRALGTPVVFASFVDPVLTGIIDPAMVPAAPITGVSLADSLNGKRLEILREAYPAVRRVAVLLDKGWVDSYGGEARILADGPRLGLSVAAVYAETLHELESLMTSPAAASFDAWYVPPTYIAYLGEARIIAHIRRLQKPAIFSTTNEVREGGLMAYEQDTAFVWDTLAELAARVLAGEDPRSIPVERPRRYILSVRYGPEFAITPMAPSVVRRADRIF